MATKEMIGKRFGKYTVISLDETSSNKAYKYFCRCDCGKVKSIRGAELRRGRVYSCGCARRTHYMTHSRLYRIWSGLKNRCHNSSCKNYCGKGISVCDEWKNSFENFMEWSLASGYADNLTIDRINNSGNYEPSNCRWISDEEQNRNKTDTVLMECDGEVHCQKEWARILGISYYKFRYWIKKEGAIFGKQYRRVFINQ